MIITFMDGTKREARIYIQTGTEVRVAIEGHNDILRLTSISGQWLTETCEPVQIEFAWQTAKTEVHEADCICSQELATRLIKLLYDGETDRGERASAAGSTA